MVHVAGPVGSGKTKFVEAMLEAADGPMLAARCVRDDSLRRSRETRPKTHPELRRYRQAGASGVAVFRFPEADVGSDEFYTTDLMADYSQAVILEGDNPVGFTDLEVFVAPVLTGGEGVFKRRRRNLAAEQRARAAAIRGALRLPGGAAALLEATLGRPMVEFAERHPELFDRARGVLLDALAASRKGPPPKPRERWVLADRLAGAERAGLVVFNIRSDKEREAAERLAAELARLRKDEELFGDIIGPRGSRTPITAVVANLADSADPGRRKALARVRRCVRSVSA